MTGQTYINGVISDTKSNNTPPKDKLLQMLNPKARGVSFTKLELIDSATNYYKHHDEWSKDWKLPRANTKTILVLNKAGIDHNTDFPCYTAATKIYPEKHIADLGRILGVVSVWRKRVIRAARNWY